MGSPVDDALAVLRRGCYLGGELPTVEEVEAALATVRSALERQRRHPDAWSQEAFDQQKARAEAAEAELSRLREQRDEAETRRMLDAQEWHRALESAEEQHALTQREMWGDRGVMLDLQTRAEAAEAELQRLRGGISVRDALVTENAIRAAAAEAEVQRYREGLREAVDMIRFPCAECKSFIDKARALLADSPDGANTEGGEA